MTEEGAKRGARAEEMVARHLSERGLRVIARNWRCSAGELDIVALSDEALVFVEVRSRSGERYGSALESIGDDKIARVLAAAEYFVMEHPQYADLPWQIDLAAITTNRNGVVQQYRHLENVIID